MLAENIEGRSERGDEQVSDSFVHIICMATDVISIAATLNTETTLNHEMQCRCCSFPLLAKVKIHQESTGRCVADFINILLKSIYLP